MLQLQQQKERIEALNLKILIITFEHRAIAEAYAKATHLEWPMIVDENREWYQAFNMHKGGRWKIFGPSSWWTYIKLLFRGRKLKSPTGDVRQLGGDILIAPEGEVKLHHVGETPADRPEVDAILKIIEQTNDVSPG